MHPSSSLHPLSPQAATGAVVVVEAEEDEEGAVGTEEEETITPRAGRLSSTAMTRAMVTAKVGLSPWPKTFH